MIVYGRRNYLIPFLGEVAHVDIHRFCPAREGISQAIEMRSLLLCERFGGVEVEFFQGLIVRARMTQRPRSSVNPPGAFSSPVPYHG